MKNKKLIITVGSIAVVGILVAGISMLGKDKPSNADDIQQVESSTETQSTESTLIVDADIKDDAMVEMPDVEQDSNTDNTQENTDSTQGNSGAGHTIHDDGYISEEVLEGQEAARRENAETAAFGETLPGDGTVDEKLRDWVKSQGADYMLGWTIIFEHGKGAGDQPTYGIYMNENSERYLERFEVGDYLPCNTQLTGTMEEYEAWMAQDLKDTIMENGEEGEDYEIRDDGTFVIIID